MEKLCTMGSSIEKAGSPPSPSWEAPMWHRAMKPIVVVRNGFANLEGGIHYLAGQRRSNILLGRPTS
jgi:hypothetical protein